MDRIHDFLHLGKDLVIYPELFVSFNVEAIILDRYSGSVPESRQWQNKAKLQAGIHSIPECKEQDEIGVSIAKVADPRLAVWS